MKSLTVWTGPVSSEKSTGALRTAKRCENLGQQVTLIRPAKSIRPHEKPSVLVTKNGETFPSLDLNSSLDIKDITTPVIWIDEPFLFDDEEELFDVIQELRKDHVILVSTLNMDCEMKGLKTTVPRLLAVADKIIFNFADCISCKSMGIASRTILWEEVILNDQIYVGNIETYKPVCPLCYNSLIYIEPSKRKTWTTSLC